MAHEEMLVKLVNLPIGESINIAGIEFERADNGVLIDSEFVLLNELEDHLDILFHYEEMDNQE